MLELFLFQKEEVKISFLQTNDHVYRSFLKTATRIIRKFRKDMRLQNVRFNSKIPMYFWILSLKKAENEIKEIIPFKMASETVRINLEKESKNSIEFTMSRIPSKFI